MTILHCFLSSNTPYWYVVIIYAIRMFSVALIIMPLNTKGVNSLNAENISHGTAIMNFLRIMAGAIGTAVMITILAIVRKSYAAQHAMTESKTVMNQHATVQGIDAAFIFTTILLIIGFICTLLIKNDKKQTSLTTNK